jgi:hypothetical protein
MRLEDAENLERLEKKLALVRDRVRSVALRYNTGFFLFGAGGSGKSFAVRGELESLGTRWMLHNSTMTAAGLFDTLHDFPEHVHVLEDMEQLYSDRKAVGYLRSATWGDDLMQNRVITKTIHRKRVSFEFKGGIIILSNLPLGEIASLRALATRLNPAEFNPTEGEKRALMWKIAEAGKLGLPAEACEEVCEYLVHYAKDKGKPLDLRLLDNAFGDRLMYDRGESRTHWRDLVTSRIDAQIVEPKITPRTRQARLVDERDIAKQIYDKYPDSREDRYREWKERTGRSERALYRRAAELGLDAPPRFLSTEDIEDFGRETVNLSNGPV